MGRRGFFLLIPFLRFNRPRGERPLEAVWSGGSGFCGWRFAYLLFYAPALSLDSAAATSSPLNYFSSPAQARPALKPSVKVLCRPSLIYVGHLSLLEACQSNSYFLRFQYVRMRLKDKKQADTCDQFVEWYGQHVEEPSTANESSS